MTDFDEPIYLDYNATTPVADEVVEAMLPYFRRHFGNPSSDHGYGHRVREAVERARQQVAKLIGAGSEEIIFTSGGTESNNLAIMGCVGIDEVVTSAIEHAAVTEPCRVLADRGVNVEWIGVDEGGRLDVAAFEEAVAGGVDLVTVMHSNNETGVIQPVADCAKMAKEAGAVVHTDAAQSVGKLAIDVDELGVDMLSIAGHKLFAPKGIGALYVREGTALAPLSFGASHERGLRPGTENVASIVGLGKACELIMEASGGVCERIAELRDRLWERLDDEISGLRLNGHRRWRLPNTLNVRFPDVTAGELLEVTPQIAASSGSACHDVGTTASSVITAMGVEPEEALGSVRLSLGRGTTEEDVDRGARYLIAGFRQLKS